MTQGMSTLHPPSPPTPTPQQPPSKQMSKVILRTALQKANSAVMCDSSNDVVGAIDAYSEAISLLNRVLTTVEKGSDRRRLQEIHDSYSERIRLLSTISPKSDIDDLYETFDEEEQKATQVLNEYYGEEEEEEEDENDAKSWLSKPAKRKFSTRQTGAPQYASVIRHMASSSSLESQKHLQQQQQQCKRSSMTTSATNKTDPPSPVSSKSTPTRSTNRRSTSSSVHTTEETSAVRASSLSTTSSVDSFSDPQQEATASPPLHHDHHNHNHHHHQQAPPTSNTSSTSAQASREPTMTLPPLKATKIEAAGERTSSLRQQPSNASMRSTYNPIRQSSITSNTTTTTTTTNTTATTASSGFASVRKKSSNRLSRVSIDGAATMRRGHSSGASPLLGLFVRSQNANDNESSMDYFGHHNNHNRIGMAYSTDSVMMPMEATGAMTTNNSNQPPLHLVLSIEKSMDQGAYITPRLYIPKNMWNQPNIRLPNVEVKAAACETLINDLAKLEQWHKLDDLTGSLKVLEILEDAVESLQASLAKKLKRDSMSADNPTASSPSTTMTPHYDAGSIGSSSSSKKSQAFMSWGTKLSKSVERMNAFSLTKTEDQYRNYVEVLQRMLVKIHILTDWWDHYIAMKKDTGRMSPVCDVVLQRLTRICDVVDIVVGGFVVRDMAVLLGKWLKRGGSWVNE
ncbi:hypothetical protein BDB00DRAFT_812206 [Zychaea mexicana]|uniref:uncharacterized protein n=1 Tax=Zychaea mexicana TaxID=64656 RepID=UPI0022FF3683|nr:uncharacterized protein BDB00DRAFT_812206 [Zychaea mexicana]KAI9495858.1 hypothetical protein BDB00DRAFT_812206 [Zychaea mexicana]